MTPPVPTARRLGAILCAKQAEHASGILTASRGKLRRLFCLEKGWLVFAASNLLEEQFLEVIVRRGVIEPSVRADAVERAQNTGRKPVRALLDRGEPSLDRLKHAMEALVGELLASTLEWPDGRVEFAAGQAQLEDEITVRMSPLALVLRHARSHPSSFDAVRIRIGPPDLKPVLSPASEHLVRGMAFDEVGSYVLASCDGRSDLDGLVERSPASEEVTLRSIYGFLLAGILTAGDSKPAAGTARPGDLVPSRDECLATVQRASRGDHYAILGVERDAQGRQIREAYYSIARRFHPDRFRSGEMQDLLPEMEKFFTRVTEAYNTLDDPERRAEYDQQSTTARETDAARGVSETAHLAKQNWLRGKAAAMRNKFAEAVAFLENAITLDDSQADYHLELGVVLAKNPRRREEAEQAIRRAISLAPANANAYVALGHLHQRAGRRSDALNMFREALRWDPDQQDAKDALAELGAADGSQETTSRRGIFRS